MKHIRSRGFKSDEIIDSKDFGNGHRGRTIRKKFFRAVKKSYYKSIEKE